MTEKICVGCSTENAPHFIYCKNCGATLPVVDKIRREVPSAPENPSFDELSYREYSSYIGSGSESILYDFRRLETSRVVFSLPLLFLGIVFGFYGMSSWFFFRKMKKIGLIMLGLGVLLTVIDAVLNFSLNRTLVTEILRIFGGAYGAANLEYVAKNMLNYYSYYLVSISTYIGFFSSFFVSAIGLSIYKNHSYKNALAIKSNWNEEAGVPLDLLLEQNGGISIGLAVIPLVLWILVPTASVFVGLI